MSKLLILLAIVVAISITASSEVFAADINFGKCSSQIESWQHKYIAPGQVKTGPSTGNLGDLKFPGGFDGGMGCSK